MHRPHEIAFISSGGSDLILLIDVAHVANKYAFKSTETWALDAIYGRVIQQVIPPRPDDMAVPQPPPSLNPLKTMDQLARLLRLTQLCNHQRLLNTLISILSDLTRSSTHYALVAMTIADELDIPSLRGVSYLEVLQKYQVDKWSMPEPVRPYVQLGEQISQSNTEKIALEVQEEMPVMTPAQRTRLLTGFYRLTRTWERIRLSPPGFGHALACGATWHQHGCTLSWAEFWRERTRSEAVLSLSVADVLGRLEHIQKEYERVGNTTYMHPECRLLAKKCLLETIRRIEDGLPEFF
ncbi:hypothetical protein AX15_003763 [Amanita polypyramis BW_CC]|nr:hypothetical protein AX15_003763 [Amanita polypyramis BW_CC]